jgi:D-sedoheptulose 7-phosphate isomerase
MTEKDVLLCLSTSGNSANVINAARVASEFHYPVLGLTGKTGGELSKLVDLQICVDSEHTAHIQEAHIFILHCLCALIEENL